MKSPLTNLSVYEFPKDLADQCDWEDDASLFVTLEEAGLEEPCDEPLFGLDNGQGHGVMNEVAWWLDGDFDEMESHLSH